MLFLKNNMLFVMFLFLFLLLNIANGIHHCFCRKVKPSQLFYITELTGLARLFFIGFSVAIALVFVAKLFFASAELLLTLLVIFYCYYLVVIAMIYRKRNGHLRRSK